MLTFRDVCKYIGSQLRDAVCAETGCMYVCPPGNEVHTTTNNIYEFVLGNRGTLYSLDIDREHIDFATEFCCPVERCLSGNEEWVAELFFLEGDSVKTLKALSKDPKLVIDLLCLDSKEFDEDHMVNEYRAIEESLRPDKHFVLADDIHNPNSVKYKKMVPLLKQLGYNYIEVPTPTGLFMAAKGYELPE